MHALNVIWHSPHILLISTHSYSWMKTFFQFWACINFNQLLLCYREEDGEIPPFLSPRRKKFCPETWELKPQDFFFSFSQEKVSPETREADWPWRGRGRVPAHWVLHCVFYGGCYLASSLPFVIFTLSSVFIKIQNFSFASWWKFVFVIFPWESKRNSRWGPNRNVHDTIMIWWWPQGISNKVFLKYVCSKTGKVPGTRIFCWSVCAKPQKRLV